MIFLNKNNLKDFGIELIKDEKQNFFHVYRNGNEVTTLDLTDLDIFGIDVECFKNCMCLKKVILPPQLKTIKRFAFKGCISLKEVVFNENLQVIEEGAFGYCSLNFFHAPKSLTYIGSSAFIQNGIKDILLNDGLKTIDDYAFCTNFIEEIFIPNSVTDFKFSSIGEQLINKKTNLYIPPHLYKPFVQKPTIQIYKSLDEVIKEAKNFKQINNFIKISDLEK